VNAPRDLDEEREFQDFLKRKRSPFPRDPAADEPPAELDLRVLGQARQAIEADTGTVRPRAIPWLVPFATAATVVIAFAMFRDIGDQVPTGTSSPSVSASDKSAPSARAPTVEEALIEVEGSAAVEASPSPAPVPAPVVELPTPVSPPPQAVSAPSAPLIAQSSPAPATNVTADSATEAARAAESDAVSEIVVTGNSATAARQTVAKGLDSSKVRDPDVWWAAIELLRASGKTAEADRELVEFRRLFPNYQPPRPPPPATEATPPPAP
jgi:hypothetical protein